jgi:hypothetical protein
MVCQIQEKSQMCQESGRDTRELRIGFVGAGFYR